MPLEGRESQSPLYARLGTQLLTAGIVGETDEHLHVGVSLLDAYGPVAFSPEDLVWKLPEGFPEIKYSCFNDSLCIFEWKPTREQEAIALCLKVKPQPCFEGTPPDPRGPYKYVAVGQNHTCALTVTDQIRCWGDNFFGQLGAPQAIPSSTRAQLVTGNHYKSVTAGTSHSCAVHASNGLVDCWGDNSHFQLTGNANPSKVITINSKVPLTNRGVQFMAAGETTTCAQVSNDDTVCWGKPSANSPTSSASPGFVALHASYARSMATDVDDCNGFRNCARICITDLGGELSCGHWKAGTPPPQLSEVPDPKGVAVISWTQVDVAPNHVCAVTQLQDVWCFGDNSWGQFGTGVWSSTRTDVPATAANR